MPRRIGLIGRGKWGGNIERTLVSLGNVAVIPIGRNEPVRHDLDGVIIASPSATHAEVALPYIEAGIAAFIEKPMATSVVDARRIRDAAARTRTVVFVGHLQLYNPAFQTLLRILPGLGAVRYVLCDSANDNPRTDSSVLWDWVPHDLYMARAILGDDPTSVQALSLTSTQNVQAAVARYQYGAVSLVSMVSWLSPLRRREVTVCAERGVIVFDDRAAVKRCLHHRDGTTSHPIYDPEQPLANELRAFLKLIGHHSSDASHVTRGIAIAHAIESAEESIRKGGVVIRIGI
jgi:predicted dehydrogenase